MPGLPPFPLLMASSSPSAPLALPQVLFVGPTGTGKTVYIKQVGTRSCERAHRWTEHNRLLPCRRCRHSRRALYPRATDTTPGHALPGRTGNPQGLDALAAAGGHIVVSTAFSAQTSANQARGRRVGAAWQRPPLI